MRHYTFLLFICLILFSCKRDDNTNRPIYETEENLTILSQLPEAINESSGLVLTDGILWTHNDSGDQPKIYDISQTDTRLEKEVLITNAKHRDWEDIAQDATHLYIGDFGNNGGNRTDLTIYKISKTGLVDSTNAEKIEFSFSDQVDFNNTNRRHDFDCEAMIVYNNSIYLFSKNHVDQHTRLYRLPTDPGIHVAQEVDNFHTDGLITGASINKNNKVICLLGYQVEASTFNPFVWIFYNFEGNNFFEGNAKRVSLPIQAQTEGICLQRDSNFLISNESEEGEEANLYLFEAEKWMD